jgi:hypothetical protein
MHAPSSQIHTYIHGQVQHEMLPHGMHTVEQLACFCLRSGARDGGGEQERRGEERPDGSVVATWTHASCLLCAACFCGRCGFGMGNREAGMVGYICI